MSKIEEKFYETFKIEPIELEFPDNTEYYPEITDRILVELIKLHTRRDSLIINKNSKFKDEVLQTLIDDFKYEIGYKTKFIKQVQRIFQN